MRPTFKQMLGRVRLSNPELFKTKTRARKTKAEVKRMYLRATR